jgi:glycosyltransferase involved in cell wall biosynthesis
MSALPRLGPGDSADVAFLLEGTYPYVKGGVSTWVHELITGLPELRFAVVFLGSTPEHYGEIRYQLPPNLVHLETHYLMDRQELPRPRARRGCPMDFQAIEGLHDALEDRAAPLPESVHRQALERFGPDGSAGVGASDFYYSEESWRRIREQYEARSPGASFLDYFWTVRTMHGPLFTLARIADRLPRVRLVHAVSTGYAGLLGALLEQRRGCPFVLTEHGIYTKERRLDLTRAGWIKEGPGHPGDGDGLGPIREMWIRFFEGLGRMAYAAAQPIVSLYEGNRQRQIADGAEPGKTLIVPNGIDVARFAALAPPPVAEGPPVVGLVGRVVPIKDVRTFIRAMRVVQSARPDVEAWIVGPTDEDPAYAEECRDLAVSLGLEGRLKFQGLRAPEEVFPRLRVAVLTSISEALPLVLLESFAAGVPVVATDVGACRALIEGGAPADKALGAAGIVTPIADPEATGRAVLRLLGNREAWAAARQAGAARVRRLYTSERMLAAYQSIYDKALEGDHGRDRLRAS